VTGRQQVACSSALYLGDYRVRLSDRRRAFTGLPRIAVITDPPYGRRTHEGQHALRADVPYAHWTPEDVAEFVTWATRTATTWVCAMTSDDLIGAYRDAYRAAGWYDFAPVPILRHIPRLTGDGPASCAVYLMVARPRQVTRCGSLPGWYMAEAEHIGHPGAKPVALMQRIVADYTAPGDLVVDPCAGMGSTLVAAWPTRHAVGCEIDEAVWRRAKARLDGVTGQGVLL